MVYKFTSAREVVAKIYADLDMQEELHRITDIREWITEAIEKIGAYDQYVKKVVTLPVVDYRVKVPGDLKNLIQCGFSFEPRPNKLIPMTMATGSFDTWGADKFWCRKWDEYGPGLLEHGDIMEQLIHLVMRLYPGAQSTNDAKDIIMRISNADKYHCYDDHKEPPMTDSGWPKDVHGKHAPHNHRHGFHQHPYDITMPVLLSMLNTNISVDTIQKSSPKTNFKPVYTLNGGYINVNVRGGFLTISYQAFNTDEDGFPMIPDIASYKEAIYWYVTMKLKFPEVMRGQCPADIYMEIKNNWHIYRRQAYGECTMPNVDELQTMQNNWQRLVPEIEENHTFFTHSGDEQEIYNQTNRPYFNYRNRNY